MPRTLGLIALLVVLTPIFAQDKPKASPPKPTSKVELEIIKRTNEARAREKKPPLVLNDLLMKAARDHAANMVKQNLMSHDLDGKNASDRVKALGYEYAALAENIAMGQMSPADVLKMWMNSEGHRTNILGEFTEIGVAQVKAAKGYAYVQVFGTPAQP